MADILIRGMEMPKEGYLPLNIYPDGRVSCNLNYDCARAVPLPEKHGKLGDLDALCAGLVSNHPVVIYAKNAPTIVPAEGGNR